MSTRSIDLQNVLSKTQEVGRVQKVQDETPALYQEAAMAEASRESGKRKERVPPSPRGEEDGVRPAGRDPRGGVKGKSKGKGEAKTEIEERLEEHRDERAQGSGQDGGKGRFIDVEV